MPWNCIKSKTRYYHHPHIQDTWINSPWVLKDFSLCVLSVLSRCSASQDVRQWCSDPCVPDSKDTQGQQRTLTRTLSRDTALSPEWSTMRKKTEDSVSYSMLNVTNNRLTLMCAYMLIFYVSATFISLYIIYQSQCRTWRTDFTYILGPCLLTACANANAFGIKNCCQVY